MKNITISIDDDLHPDLRADWQIANAEVRMWN